MGPAFKTIQYLNKTINLNLYVRIKMQKEMQRLQ